MDVWEFLAIVFGYPKCCYEEFKVRMDKPYKDLINEEPRKLWGTGYIPCASCNEKYSEEQLIERINSKRHYCEPFPKHSDSKLREQFPELKGIL